MVPQEGESAAGGREDCISGKALPCCGIASAALLGLPPSATECQAFHFAGRSGIDAALARRAASALQWSSRPAGLQPALSLEHPPAPQGWSASSVSSTGSASPKPGPLLICLSVVVGQFCTEGKMYLSILEDTGFWLESKVLSFIQDQEEEYLKLHRVVYQQIIQVRIFKTQKPFSLPSLWRASRFYFYFKVVT